MGKLTAKEFDSLDRKGERVNINDLKAELHYLELGDIKKYQLSFNDYELLTAVLLKDSPGSTVYFYDEVYDGDKDSYITMRVPKKGLTMEVLAPKMLLLRKKLKRGSMGITGFTLLKKGHYTVNYDT